MSARAMRRAAMRRERKEILRELNRRSGQMEEMRRWVAGELGVDPDAPRDQELPFDSPGATRRVLEYVEKQRRSAS